MAGNKFGPWLVHSIGCENMFKFGVRSGDPDLKPKQALRPVSWLSRVIILRFLA